MEITDLSWNENLSKRFNTKYKGVNCWKIWMWKNNVTIKPFT